MKKNPQKPIHISALTARTQLGQIMQRAAVKGERFLVGRRGQPTVVIMSVADYSDAVATSPDWLDTAWKEAALCGANKLTAREIDREIKAYRKAKRQRLA